MADKEERQQVQIEVPPVSGEEVGEATELVEHLIETYGISSVDADALFNAMVAIYIRMRMIHGDRPPAQCACGAADVEPGDDRN